MALRLSGLQEGRPDKAFMPPSGKSAYLNDKRVAVQALSELLEEDGDFVKHRRVGLVAGHFHYIFQLVDLTYHLLQTLIVVDQ
jgi:hypothetical protein